ncbi:MAG: hypothetical protein ACE5J9_00615 [Methanosarcinales archaeon]
MSTAKNIIFEKFIDKLNKRKEELEELKDDLLIYNDPEFMESIKRGLKDLEKKKKKL